MKKANFDVTHELDEFLMVEKPLTHSKRKVNPDLEKMKPEIRQMEEQYVIISILLHTCPIADNPFTGLPSTISAAQNACHTIRIIYLLYPQGITRKVMSQHHYNHKPTRGSQAQPRGKDPWQARLRWTIVINICLRYPYPYRGGQINNTLLALGSLCCFRVGNAHHLLGRNTRVASPHNPSIFLGNRTTD
jgi:hypothetical protein